MIKLKDLLKEAESDAEAKALEYLQQLKQRVADAHKEADERYNAVAHQSTGYTPGNIFEPTRVNYPDAQEGHRNALLDGQYRFLKKKAIDLEAKYRQLEKRVKKSSKPKKKHTACPYCRAYAGGPCPYCRAYNK